LNAENLYENPKNFARQGDIFINQEGMPQPAIVPSHWMLMSHTCNVTNDIFCTISHVYEESYFLERLKDLGLGMPLSAIRQNKKARIVWLPPSNYMPEDYSGLVVDLAQSYTMLSAEISKILPFLSLSFPGHAYLFCRQALYQFRDVEKWDDGRTTGRTST
jgi:hypothetical protein